MATHFDRVSLQHSCQSGIVGRLDRGPIADIDQNGPVATAFVTAASPAGQVASQPLTFIAGPSPTGWQLSKSSAMALISAVG